MPSYSYQEALERALKIARERRPDAAPQRHAAFANSVAYLLTGTSGGYGGPSVREHAASHQFGGQRLDFDQAVKKLIADDGPIFGPLTELHRQLWTDENCFDDDPADIAALTS